MYPMFYNLYMPFFKKVLCTIYGLNEKNINQYAHGLYPKKAFSQVLSLLLNSWKALKAIAKKKTGVKLMTQSRNQIQNNS